jgi:hypothetical protein
MGSTSVSESGVTTAGFGASLRGPPSAPLVGDDEHLALVATVLQGGRTALPSVQFPGPSRVFQHGGAVHVATEQLAFCIDGHGAMRPGLARSACGRRVSLSFRQIISRPGDREADRMQGRRFLCPGRAMAPLAAWLPRWVGRGQPGAGAPSAAPHAGHPALVSATRSSARYRPKSVVRPSTGTEPVGQPGPQSHRYSSR